MISFIVPAHNEQADLGRTLEAIHEAGGMAGRQYEVIVVDDASTDATAQIARQNNARVVSVNHRQIAATRNAGGRAAQGRYLLFIDADTVFKPSVVTSALRHLDQGAAGGGAPARFDRLAPLYARLLLGWFNLFARLAGISGGAFLFCTREAFHATGGFDERLFGAEDAAMSWSLKRQGPFAVLWYHVLTSGRRMRGMRGPPMVAALIGMAFAPQLLTRRANVERLWYDSDRQAEDSTPRSLAVFVVNTLMLVVTLAMIAGPLWNLVPWSLTPRTGPLGKIRIGLGVFTCHVALVLWPCAWFLLCLLFRQTRWLERVKIVALLSLCLWSVWTATQVVVWFWPWLWGWLVQGFLG